jgi:hypothetical protein
VLSTDEMTGIQALERKHPPRLLERIFPAHCGERLTISEAY